MGEKYEIIIYTQYTCTGIYNSKKKLVKTPVEKKKHYYSINLTLNHVNVNTAVNTTCQSCWYSNCWKIKINIMLFIVVL